jgi:hypothetical protein
MIQERRRRRSTRKEEALRLLLEAVRERSEISSIAIVDGRGMVVEGTGPEHELMILGMVAATAASGEVSPMCQRMTEGTDILSCPLEHGEKRLYLAALGDRVSRMPEAVRSVTRILRTG